MCQSGILIQISRTLLMRQLNSISLQSFLRSSLGLHIMVKLRPSDPRRLIFLGFCNEAKIST